MTRLTSPQWEDFNWMKQPYDAFGDRTPGIRHFHAEGPGGMGIESPSGRDYGAVVSGTTGSWRLSHVEEYSGISDIADQISDAMAFMDVTGAKEVDTTHDENRHGLDSTDLMKNLYDKRPNFPRTFKTPRRAMTVAELLIKRRDANIPLTPRRTK